MVSIKKYIPTFEIFFFTSTKFLFVYILENSKPIQDIIYFKLWCLYINERLKANQVLTDFIKFQIKLKSPGIYIPNLESIPLLQPQPSRYLKLESGSSSKQYQVCMCSNGKLFVSKANGECSVNNDGVQCR